ncbi:MAG: hypothetical protein AABX13_03655 [Nanoarchaeota archaeon]
MVQVVVLMAVGLVMVVGLELVIVVLLLALHGKKEGVELFLSLAPEKLKVEEAF